MRVSLAWILPSVFAATLSVMTATQSWWPNSADEYGYLFLARTLLHHRLWNPPPPAPAIFDVAWIYVRDGKWFSQYPPGWPAILAPFLLCGAAWLVNPLLTVMLGWLFMRAGRAMKIEAQTVLPLAALTVFSPFVLFNGASLFAHTLTACLVLTIILLSKADEASRSARARLGMGAAFGALLLTRYDVLLLVAVPFIADRLWYRRASLHQDVLPLALGGAPFFLACLAYDHAITGHAFKTPYAWVSGGAHIGLGGKHTSLGSGLAEAASRTAHWSGELALFTSPLLIGLAAAACWAKLRTGTLRWYDGLFPVAVVFFFFYPATGGHEFGPRYWFFAWPAAMLAIGDALGRAGDGCLDVGRQRIHVATLAVVHAPVFLGVCLSIALFTRVYVDARRQVLDVQVPRTPAVVLIPKRSLMLSRLQTAPITAWSEDFARNGVELSGPILFARADDHGRDQPSFTSAACGMPGRSVYRWRALNQLDLIDCARLPR